MKRLMPEAMSRDHDFVAFEKSVGFVSRKKELIHPFLNSNCGPSCHLLPVPEGDVVREGHFAQTKEAKETRDEHGNKEEIVVDG
jgi:hypothetical protein